MTSRPAPPDPADEDRSAPPRATSDDQALDLATEELRNMLRTHGELERGLPRRPAVCPAAGRDLGLPGDGFESDSRGLDGPGDR